MGPRGPQLSATPAGTWRPPPTRILAKHPKSPPYQNLGHTDTTGHELENVKHNMDESRASINPDTCSSTPGKKYNRKTAYSSRCAAGGGGGDAAPPQATTWRQSTTGISCEMCSRPRIAAGSAYLGSRQAATKTPRKNVQPDHAARCRVSPAARSAEQNGNTTPPQRSRPWNGRRSTWAPLCPRLPRSAGLAWQTTASRSLLEKSEPRRSRTHGWKAMATA